MVDRGAGGLREEEAAGVCGDMEGQHTPSLRSSHGEVDTGREVWRVLAGSQGYGLEGGGEQEGGGMRGGRRKRALVAGLLVSAALLVTLVAMSGGQGRPSELSITSGIQGTTPEEEKAFFTHLNNQATDRVDMGDQSYKYWTKTQVRFMHTGFAMPENFASQPPNAEGLALMFRNACTQLHRRWRSLSGSP